MKKVRHISHQEPKIKAVAHKVKFVDGKMTEKVRPAARRDGTTIRATQLYHNMGTRKGTMNIGDERNKIGDIGKYEVERAKVPLTDPL